MTEPTAAQSESVELVKAWAPVIIALISMIGSTFAAYFAFRANQSASQAKADAGALRAAILEGDEGEGQG